MEFSELQDKIVATVDRYSKKNNIEINNDYAIHKLYEEVGEFAQAWLIHNRQCRTAKYVEKDVSKKMISDELADIAGIVILIAKMQKIDLEETINKKWINREK
jgi:NTP pyrophosphatase (non-canonical NTP hydrolase)